MGDEVVYSSDDGSTYRVHFQEIESYDVPGSGTCNAISLMERTGDRSNNVAENSRRFCLDSSLTSVRLYSGENPYTGQMEWTVVTGIGLGTHEGNLVCRLICNDLSPEGLKFRSNHPPDQYIDYHVKPLPGEDAAFVIVSALTQLREGETTTDTTYRTYWYGPGPYAERIEMMSVNTWSNNTEPRRWNLTLKSTEAGGGPPISLNLDPSGSNLLDSDAVEWEHWPVEGVSPFRYSQESALSILDTNLDYLLFRQEHPDAFLAMADYHELPDPENSQTEYLWGFLWQEGASGFAIKCHVLVSPIPEDDMNLFEYEEKRCFDAEQRNMPHLVRSQLPEKVLSWEGGVSLWHTAIGSEVPLTSAYWTVYPEIMFLGKAPKDFHPSDGNVTMVFNYNLGLLHSDPYSPTWLSDELINNINVGRGSLTSFSTMDAETGRFFLITSPNSRTL